MKRKNAVIVLCIELAIYASTATYIIWHRYNDNTVRPVHLSFGNIEGASQ